MKYFLIIISLFCFLPIHAQEVEPEVQQDSVRKTVLATYYHRKFEGRRTSSGARYRAKNYTAAHRSLPFGTLVTVTNPSNGKAVVVKINDRGPFSKKLAIDISESAAKKIGIYRKGIAKVKLSYTIE